MKGRTVFVFVAAVAVIAVAHSAPAAHNCSATCSQTACSTDCNETDLRSAVSIINTCGGNRTLTFNAGYGCTVNMAQTSSTAACTGDPEANAVCLTGSNIVIDGQDLVLFNYSGTGRCASDPAASPQPALFTLKGTGNTVKNFSMKYFPEGIHIRAGNNHRVEGVTNGFICEEALTIDSGAGSGHVITANAFTGNTTPEAGRNCYENDGVTAGLCGTDKAIQINNCGSCTSTIDNNLIDTIGQPVNLSGGTHTISNNTTTGAPTNCAQGDCEEVCQAYSVQGSGRGNFDNNTIQLCKFGIRVVDGGSALVTGNTMKDNYVTAFQVKGSGAGKLKGSGNRMKNNGFFTSSDSQRGALVDKDNASGRIDFGGGDFAGSAVLDGTNSAGGNIFCQGSLNDVHNGGNGSIGARTNCFDNAPQVVGSNVNTSGNSTCSVGDCGF